MSSIKDIKKESNIQVVVRIRPPTEKEILEGYPISVSPKDSNQVVAIPPHATTTRTFTFDKVFGQHDSQATIYNEIVSPMIKEVLEGYNCTIFAYGQTGTGKTYTMEGDLTEIKKDNIVIEKDCGMIPRALDELFNYLNQDGIEYSLRVSCIEIYNEQLKDLLTSDTSLKLQFYENSLKKVMVKNLEEIPVKNVFDAIQLFQKGMNERKTASTNYNERSSRSHCVYSITVHITENTQDQDLIKIGKLNLVDLAGSESIGRSGAENKQAREAGIINQSLLALGRVINSLVEKAQHIPYRESKLTRLLQDSLGGKTKTCIIATVSPTRYNIEESLSTLDYAFRAKNIRNKPEVNQHMTKKALIQDYMSEIKQLKNMLRCAREKDGVYLSNEDYNQLKFSCSVNEEENRRLKKLLDSQDDEISGLKHSLKDKSDELQDLKVQIDKNLQTIMQKELDIRNLQQNLTEESVLLKSHMLTEDNLNTILNDLNQILKKCSLELYKYHLFTDKKLSLERDNRKIFNDFRNNVIRFMEELIIRLDIIKSRNNEYDTFLFNTIKDFITNKIKSLNDISNDINNKFQERKSTIQKFNISSIEHITTNENIYQSMKDYNSKFMEDFYALFNNNMLNVEDEFNSVNNAFDNKNEMINQYNELIEKEISNFKEDLSSFINLIMNQMISVKNNIIEQKNKEISELKRTIELINNKKSMELKKINDDKNKLLNNIKELIETFSNTHSKVFTETIEPVKETLTMLSNNMEGEIKQFNTEINEIETTINKNNNSFNNDIISLKSKIETNNKDNVDFINNSKDRFNRFNKLLNEDMEKISKQIDDYINFNTDSLSDLEIKTNEYKTSNKLFNENILLEVENDRLFINKYYNDNIKSYDEFLDSIIKNHNENEHIKTDNYNDYQSISEQLNDNLIKSNTIFKENPLLNEAPEKNKYYNIYSWKITPNHDNIINNYRELCKEKKENLIIENQIINEEISMNYANNNGNENGEINMNDISDNRNENDEINMNDINDNGNESENENKNENENENENYIIDNSESDSKTYNENINDEFNEDYDCNNENENKINNMKNTEIIKSFEEETENIIDFTVNDISIKKLLYLSNNNINYDYKEKKLEKLEEEDKLFNYELIKNNFKSNSLSNTKCNNENSLVKGLNVINSSSDNENNISSDLDKKLNIENDNNLNIIELNSSSEFIENNDISINENYISNEFESINSQNLSNEISENKLPFDELENNENLNMISEDTIEIIINRKENDDFSIDSDSSIGSNISRKSVKNNKNLLKSKNNQKTKSIQKMDSAIELEEKLNKGKYKLTSNDDSDEMKINKNLDVSLRNIKKNISMSSINNVRDSLVTRKTFKNQKPLSGFNFIEKKKPISRSSSVPNTPTVVNKHKKLLRSEDDLSLKNVQAIKFIKPAIEPF